MGVNRIGKVQTSDGAECRKKEIPENLLLPSGTLGITQVDFRGQKGIFPSDTHTHAPLFIIDFIEENPRYDAIVELGCGFGQNIIKMRCRG